MKLFHRFQLNISGCSVRVRKSHGRQSWCTKRWRTWTGRTSPPNPSSSTWWTWMTTLGGTVTHFFRWHFKEILRERTFPMILNFLFDCQMVNKQTRLMKKRVHGKLSLLFSVWQFFGGSTGNCQIGALLVHLTHTAIVCCLSGLQRAELGILKVWIHQGVAILVTWVLSHSLIHRGAFL